MKISDAALDAAMDVKFGPRWQVTQDHSEMARERTMLQLQIQAALNVLDREYGFPEKVPGQRYLDLV